MFINLAIRALLMYVVTRVHMAEWLDLLPCGSVPIASHMYKY